MSLARRVRDQDRHQRGPKVYSLHAPEVECIGKGKAHRPYEFGVKVSVVTTLKRSTGGQVRRPCGGAAWQPPPNVVELRGLARRFAVKQVVRAPRIEPHHPGPG